jgi:molybdopterin-binding protein
MTAGLALLGEDLRKSFKRGGFSLDVERIEAPAGETLALLGPSGSGKTTLLHLLGLLERPDNGRVLLGGREVSASDKQARMGMAAVFQRPYLFKGSVASNVGYGLDVRGVRGAEYRERVAGALERVGLAGYGSRSALSLSGGEAQRVSLARALVLEPGVLLLDEPLASLDSLLKRRLSRDFASILRSSGVTVVYVTHDQDEAMVVADRVAILNGGRIVSEGPIDAVMGLAADEWTAAFLGIETASNGIVRSSSDGLVEVSVADSVVLASGDAAVGSEVLIAVLPEDVLLFEGDAALPLTSARNRMRATVSAVEPRGATSRVSLDAGGMRLAASVSRAAVSELSLSPGVEVLAVFKASAVRWRYSGNPSTLDDHGDDLPNEGGRPNAG